MTFDTVHIVRRYGARRFFLRISSIRTVRNACSTDCHHILRCGVRFFFVDNPTVRCGAVRFLLFYGTARCGFFLSRILRCGAVRCGFVRGKIVRCGAVRLNRTTPHRTIRKNRTLKSFVNIYTSSWRTSKSEDSAISAPRACLGQARTQLFQLRVPLWNWVIPQKNDWAGDESY